MFVIIQRMNIADLWRFNRLLDVRAHVQFDWLTFSTIHSKYRITYDPFLLFLLKSVCSFWHSFLVEILSYNRIYAQKRRRKKKKKKKEKNRWVHFILFLPRAFYCLVDLNFLKILMIDQVNRANVYLDRFRLYSSMVLFVWLWNSVWEKVLNLNDASKVIDRHSIEDSMTTMLTTTIEVVNYFVHRHELIEGLVQQRISLDNLWKSMYRSILSR
jgi:hypothetical protein